MAERLREIWTARADRYSELRGAQAERGSKLRTVDGSASREAQPARRRGGRRAKVEMSYIGG
jgi:hypothetical protein